jgi:tripartite-type tricarboxylate transporter receptor subunit TctC
MELLKSGLGLFILHVPFRGAAAMLQELLAGRIDMAFDTTFAAVPHVRAGRLKAIGVGGMHAVDVLPGVRRVADLLPRFDTDGWQGFFAPAGTSGAIVQELRDDIALALRSPELAARIADLGFRPVASTPADFAAPVRADLARWERLVRERHIRAE